jgi:outer membrane protein OmpA-like peptidoglycan-associated protein
MRTITLLGLAAFTLGCSGSSSYVRSDATLGRVVVYRNGIAYFERFARVEGDVLRLSVPADKVDDFLKSLTVVDTRTGEPPPIAYPTALPSSETGLIDMELQLAGPGPHDLKLSYVTETPSWKPSYRLVVGDKGKVKIQGWAVIDNTSGEDWRGVKLAVGSSSALSFRYDLQSLRVVRRETLRPDDLFAQAPPLGGATHGGPGQSALVVGEFQDDALSAGIALESREVVEIAGRAPGALSSSVNEFRRALPGSTTPNEPTVRADKKSSGSGGARAQATFKSAPNTAGGEGNTRDESGRADAERVVARIKQSKNQVIVEGYADKADGDKFAASLERANRVREQLIRRGVDAHRVVAVGQGEQAGHSGGVRIVESTQPPAGGGKAAPNSGAPDAPEDTTPIGTSHFESIRPMDVPRGTSAMVSILNTETPGEIVYLYDPESPRGSASFPFQSVRIQNPTKSTLESGPVTVFGQGKFIGEGLSEPIPAHSVGFVPFALDRQIVVDREDAERDEIVRVLTVQRGVFSTEVQHVKKATLTIHNRTDQPATVYVRRTVPQGFKLIKPAKADERLGAAHLLRIQVEPKSKTELVIEEATPLFKTADIRSPTDMEMVRVYLSTAAAEGPLKAAVGELTKLHQDLGNLEQQIRTTREQMDEYRARLSELNVQIVSLRAVKSGGDVVKHLEKTLQAMSDKLSAATLQLATLQEKQMITRIKFQDGVAELSLDKPAAAAGAAAAASAPSGR